MREFLINIKALNSLFIIIIKKKIYDNLKLKLRKLKKWKILNKLKANTNKIIDKIPKFYKKKIKYYYRRKF